MVSGFAKLLRYSKLVRILPLCAKSEVREKDVKREKGKIGSSQKRSQRLQERDEKRRKRRGKMPSPLDPRELWSLLTAVDLQRQVYVRSFMFVPFKVLLTHSQSVLRPFRRQVELLSFPHSFAVSQSLKGAHWPCWVTATPQGLPDDCSISFSCPLRH